MAHKLKTRRYSNISDYLWSEMAALRTANDGFRSPFFDLEWFRIMSRVRDDTCLFYGEDSKGLAYYWPMHVSSFNLARGIGGPFSDRNGPVTRAGFEFDIPKFLAEQNIRSFATNGLLSLGSSTTGIVKSVMNNETCLKDGYSAFLAEQTAQHKSHFKTLRRLTRKLHAEFSEVEFRFDDNRPETFEALISMKRAQFAQTGRHDVLAPDWVQNMFIQLRRAGDDNLRPRVSSLFVDGKLAAAELNLQSHQTLHGWIVAYDPAFSKYSPGNIVMHKILEAMPDQGLIYYDSGVGSDHYKKYVSNLHYPLGEGVIYASGHALNPQKIMGSAWNYAEKIAPKGISGLLTKTRQRADQVLATEVGLGPRMKGFYQALNVEI